MVYDPHTSDDRNRMLGAIGVSDFEELISAIPKELRHDRPLDIPAISEMELLEELARQTASGNGGLVCFAGGGVYDHFVPAAVDSIISRPEFMTAYTPYQAEVSQGILQVIYEFQTHICRLTGMEVANASMYDGASAAAEAIIMAVRYKKRRRAVVSETVNPLYRQVIKTYLSGREIDLIEVPMTEGQTDFERLADAVDENTACVLVAQPNFFGFLEDIEVAAEISHKVGASLIMSVDPIAQALLKTPGDYGADIVVGEGQPFGIPLSYGGPLLGFFATRKKLVRSMPGRISGRTKDVDGRDGFSLILQTREQHIRREKATSNICTNQALCATAASVYLTLMGKTGLKQVALLSAERAQEIESQLAELEGFSLYFQRPFVREFAIKTPMLAGDVISLLVEKGILPGIDAGRWYEGLDDCLIVAATEKRNSGQIQMLIEQLKELQESGVLSGM